MRDWDITKMDLLIFDLDGTLYEEQEHFEYYARALQMLLPLEKQAPFWHEYQQVKAGEHIVTIGNVYDLQHDLVLAIHPLTKEVEKVYRWNGEPLPQEAWPPEYGQPIQLGFHRMVGIGDQWILARTVALHYGVTDAAPAYQKTKLYLSSPQYRMRKTPGLKEGLARYHGHKKIVLLSNSDEDAAHQILQRLELHQYFDQLITRAGKPEATCNWFERLMTTYDVTPEQTVSIGDNLYNEVVPALQAGMKAIYIYDGELAFQHPALLQVPTLAHFPF